MTRMGTETSAPGIAIVTLGCAKNEVDSDNMRAALDAAGYRLVDAVDDADVAIVNTCSFLTAAVEEGIDTVFEVLASPGFEERGGKVVVSGCIPSRYGEELSNELSEAAAFVPVAEEGGIVAVIDRLLGVKRAQNADDALASGATALRTVSSPSAYLKISDGCDRRCAFCAIPAIRGPYTSRTADDIAAEARALAGSGVRELVLIGQDTGVWGRDLPERPHLSDLLDRLASELPDTWIRVLYVQPEGITDELLETVAAHGNIAPYFDIPVQHAAERVVREMNRAGDASGYLALLEHIRGRVPDAVLRTTVMAGFPGETDEDFAELCDFLEEARFDYTGVFAYSQEEGTAAGERTDQVDEDVKRERAEQLRDIADRIGFEKAAERVGDVASVLVEAFDEDVENGLLGRFMGQAPEVDGQVHLALPAAPNGSPVRPGDIVTVRFTDAYCYELEGEVC